MGLRFMAFALMEVVANVNTEYFDFHQHVVDFFEGVGVT